MTTVCDVRRALSALPLTAESDPKRPDATYGAFLLGSVQIGRLSPEAVAFLLKEADAASVGGGVSLADPGTPEAREARFLRLADRLASLGAVRRHRELLDVRPTDAPLSVPPLCRAERTLFRFLGMRTCAVHLIARTPSGNFWLSRRAKTKAVGPGLWDALASGLVSAGETPHEALRREALEEAGLTPETLGDFSFDELPPLTVRRPVETGWMEETSLCALVTLPKGTAVRNLDGEADAFRTFAIEELLSEAKKDRLMWEAAAGIFGAWLAEHQLAAV